jgi:hypothetical protein
MKHIAPALTPHRKTRLVAWARLLPVWLGVRLFRDNFGRTSERHLLARGFYLNLDAVARTINNIILLDACAKLGHGTGHPPRMRNYASTGFSRRNSNDDVFCLPQGRWVGSLTNSSVTSLSSTMARTSCPRISTLQPIERPSCNAVRCAWSLRNALVVPAPTRANQSRLRTTFEIVRLMAIWMSPTDASVQPGAHQLRCR